MEPITEDEIAIIRSLIPDDAPVFGETGADYMFSDVQLGHYFKVGGGNLLRASALAVYAIAASEALISKVIKTQDLMTDGAKTATALIAKADALIKMASDEEAGQLDSFFEIIDFGWGSSPELTEGEWRL